jgi:hypothetical protein
MCAIAIVILHVRKEYVAQVSLAEDGDMIEAFDRARQYDRPHNRPQRQEPRRS